MERKGSAVLQLLLRITIAASFLSAVADRFVFWDATNSSWGNWENFVAYSQTVNSFTSPQINNLLAIMATVFEALFSVLLITGYQTKFAAAGSAMLLLGFALAMTYSFGIKPSLDYSVWTAAAASYALSTFSIYQYSIDNLLATRKKVRALTKSF